MDGRNEILALMKREGLEGWGGRTKAAERLGWSPSLLSAYLTGRRERVGRRSAEIAHERTGIPLYAFGYAPMPEPSGESPRDAA